MTRLLHNIKVLSNSISFTNVFNSHFVFKQVRFLSLSQTKQSSKHSNHEISNEADVVVIGGGSVGCSTAYHLSKFNAGKVVLLEKDKITSGTTWHTAGILWCFKPSESETLMLLQTRDLISNILPSITGESAGWINNGGLHLLKSHEAYQSFTQNLSIAKSLGKEFVKIYPSEIKEMYPQLNVNDIHCAIYSPGDGTMDPSTYCMSYIKAAQKQGAEIVENCHVTNIITKKDDYGIKRISSVETNLGSIKTNVVVNCAGGWAAEIGKMVGASIPQLVFKHAYVITESIPGIRNRPIVKDHGAIYMKPQGDALHFGGYEMNPHLVENLPHDFSFGLYDLDWDVFNPHYLAAVNRIPTIENTGIRSTICGPESFTADGKPNMGEAPELRGFFVGSGFNSGGMMLGGGAGRQLAHWVCHGKPEFDLFNCDIRRYTKHLINRNKWLLEKCHSSFAKRYSLVYKHDQSVSGRNQRFSPLHEAHRSRGALFGSKNGFERPAYYVSDASGKPRDDLDLLPYDFYGQYGNRSHASYPYREQAEKDCTYDYPEESHRLIAIESLTCRTSCAIFDSSTMSKYYLSGDDVDLAVRRLFTRDVTKIASGRFVYALMLNKDGGIEGEVVVTKMRDAENKPLYYVTASSSGEQHCLSHMEGFVADCRLKCEVENKTDQLAILSIQGPKSLDLLNSALDKAIPSDLKYGEWKEARIASVPVVVARLSFVGESGYEVHCNSDDIVQVYSAINALAAKYESRMAGYRAMESLSCETGFHHWPHSIKSSDTPVEANLSRFCDDTSTYVGADAVRRLRDEPLRKRLVFFTVKSDVPLYGEELILKDGHVVGCLRTAAYAYALDCNIGCGYLPASCGIDDESISGGSYAIERMGTSYPAEVHLTSPFDPKFRRLAGTYDDVTQERLVGLLSRWKNFDLH